jgi:hypothetical protein
MIEQTLIRQKGNRNTMKKVFLYLPLALILISSAGLAEWCLPDYQNRLNISVEDIGTYTGFPLYLNLTHQTDMPDNFTGLAFTDGSCNNLSYQLDYYVNATNAYVWVKADMPIPLIQVYYNKTEVIDTQDVFGTWNNDFLGVWLILSINMVTEMLLNLLRKLV